MNKDIDYEKIIESNSYLKEGAKKGKSVLKKLDKIKEIYSSNNLNTDELDNYYSDIENLIKHLEDLNKQLTKAINASMKKNKVKSSKAGAKNE